MNLSGILVILICIAWIGVEVSTLHTNRYRTEPLFILDEYVAADHATWRCGDPDAEERQRFQDNFSAIRRNALADLAGDFPDASEATLRDRLQALIDQRIEEVNAVIEADGCDHREVWTWVKLHEVRARLNLGRRT